MAGRFAWIESGNVTSVIVADPPVIALFQRFGFFPTATFVDVTNMDPQPGIGWTYATGRDPMFRPAQPAGHVWDDINGRWAPAPTDDPELTA